jgi:sterol desaturase/sphingolipid hydroxylase (fatty acid hydroxylase superfamily)
VSVILLDLVIYLQHRLFHAVPLLWRLHRVHHADLEFDVTTGVRFHPVEIVLSMLIKIGAVVALGAPAVAVLVFEVLLNAKPCSITQTLRSHSRLTGSCD